MSQYIARWKDGFQVTWRNLTKAEYRQFRPRYEQSLFQEPMDVAVDIYRLICIDGPDISFIPAGIVSYVCKQQMKNNPFSGRYEDIVSAIGLARRVVTGSYLQSATALIASTLNYKPEEVENWDPNIFFLRLAQAEVVHGRTFDPVDPKAPVDSKGRPVAQRRTQLTSSQQKALDRTKIRDRGE